MRSPSPHLTIPAAPIIVRRQSRRKILPVIYALPHHQSKCSSHRFLPLLVVGSCGVWIFAMGALIERLPPGRGFPNFLSPDAADGTTTPSFLFYTDGGGGGGDDDDGERSSSTKGERGSSKSNGAINAVPISKNGDMIRRDSLLTDEVTGSDEPVTPRHRIPMVLIFTHAVNLLSYSRPKDNEIVSSSSSNKTHEEEIADQEELLALQKNIQHTIEMHPDATVRFLTDQDCIRSLQKMLGPNAPLIKYFQQETQGMYKADICRGAALWETGGVYLDVDVGVRLPLFDVLETNTTFATAMVHRDSNHVGNFFQAFMAATPGHKILERYLHLFLLHYQGKLTRPIKRGPLGVILLRQAFDDVVILEDDDQSSSSSSREIERIDLKPADSLTNKETHFHLGPKVLDTRHYGRIQLWQEIQYHPKYFPNVPAPTWGTRRACKFVVVANKKFPLVVPFYSRIEGSRICPKTTTASDDGSGNVVETLEHIN